MSVILSLFVGVFIGFVLMALFPALKNDDICIDCPYKRYYYDSITGLND